MQTTANLNLQKKNYSEVRSHNNRIKSRTKNRNIAWQFTRYDILNQHPKSYNKLMTNQWSAYAQHHDRMRRKNGHSNDCYGSVKSMLHQRKSTPYRAVVIGFGSGKLRRKIHRLIHRAYPKLHLPDVLKIEANAMNKVPRVYNRLFPKMPLTDYAVHVDEFKYHTGQLHLQGRVALLGKTAKGKPSFSLNQAVKQSITPYLKSNGGYDKLYQLVHGEPLKRKPRNARERLSAYRLLADHATYRTVAGELEKQFPKANLNFSFTRTEAKSVSHERWQREQDNQKAKRDATRASEASRKARSSAEALVPKFRHRYSASASKAASSAKSEAISEKHSLTSASHAIDSANFSVANGYSRLASRASYLSSSVSFASQSVARRSARVSSLANSLDYTNQKTISLFTGKSTLASGLNGTKMAVSAVNNAISSAVDSGQSALNSVNTKAKKRAAAYSLSNTPRKPTRRACRLTTQNALSGGKPSANSDTAPSSSNLDLDAISLAGQPSLVDDIDSRLANYEMKIGTDPVISPNDERVDMAFAVGSKVSKLNDESGNQESLFLTIDSQAKALSSLSANDFKILSNMNSKLNSGLGYEDDGPQL